MFYTNVIRKLSSKVVDFGLEFEIMITQAVFETRLKEMAMAVPLMCCAADMLSQPSRKQVVLVGHRSSPEFDKMLAAVHASYEPNKTVSVNFNPQYNSHFPFTTVWFQ